MILANGRFHTLDGADRIVDCVVVREGRVAFAGRRADVNPGVREAELDLGGRAVLPGLVDAHGHLMIQARARLGLDLAGATSEAEVARRVQAAAQARPGTWISGRGWDQTRWAGGRFPSRTSLDAAAPGTPVALIRIDGHATWVSSAALHAAGITRDTPDPAGGLVARDERGEPTGLLLDTAMRLVQGLAPPPSDDDFDRAVEETIAGCLAVGLTGLHEMGVDLRGLAAYRRLVERGRFPFRNYVAVAARAEEAWALYRERGPERLGDGRVTVGALKLMVDGALGSRGAALHEPYCDDPGNTGLVLLPPDELERLVRQAAARGFQVCVHAIGDRANTLTLDVLERVGASGALGPDHRARVEHAQILAPEDVPRFARLGVLPSMQATHCTSDLRWAAERLGPDRLAGAYAWRSLLATGVVIAGGSDFPVESPNPFHGLQAAVTRRPLDGSDPGWPTTQRMTRAEAVRSFTTWNAWASRQEQTLGTLEAGRAADLVVLSDDVFACPEDRIKDVAPVLTLVAGEVVYRAGV